MGKQIIKLLATLACLLFASIANAQTAAALSFGTETVENQTFTIGDGFVTVDLPAATGGTGDLTYTLAPLSNGLNFIFRPESDFFGTVSPERAPRARPH